MYVPKTRYFLRSFTSLVDPYPIINEPTIIFST